MSRRFRLPSPAMAVAIVALVLAAGGFAMAAIPDSQGVIHACYAKSGGALRIVKGNACASGEKRISWSQGIGQVTVRKTILRLHYKNPCTYSGIGTVYYCSAPEKSATAHCQRRERATGGAYGKSSDGSGTVSESKPYPTSGTPTGWTVTASGFTSSNGTTSHPDTVFPVYVICAKA